MTFNFSIFYTLFETDREEQEEDLQKFIGNILSDLHHQIKVLLQILVALVCFNCDCFIENSHPIFVALICALWISPVVSFQWQQ